MGMGIRNRCVLVSSVRAHTYLCLSLALFSVIAVTREGRRDELGEELSAGGRNKKRAGGFRPPIPLLLLSRRALFHCRKGVMVVGDARAGGFSGDDGIAMLFGGCRGDVRKQRRRHAFALSKCVRVYIS